MRMFTIPNQSSLPQAYTQFTEEGDRDGEGGSRLLPSGNRDRLVDCMEEFVKFGWVIRPHFERWGDRYSERVERRAKVDKESVKAEAEEEGNRTGVSGVSDRVNGVDIKKI